MKLFEEFAAGMARAGADCLFGVMGDGNLYMVDRFARGLGQYVAACNEAGAVLMAGGYAQTTGKVGFATVTHGPGLTNTVTALIDAARCHTPAVVIAGATSDRQAGSLQRIAQDQVAAAAEADFVEVTSAPLAVPALLEATARARAHARPVILNVPADLWWEEVEPVSATVNDGQHPGAGPLDDDALDRAVGMLATSNRPIVLAGGGALTGPARDAVARLAEQLGAPVATTLRAKGLYAGEPDDLGIFGTLGSDSTLQMIASSDCVIAFGASLNPWTTYGGSLVANKRLIHVDRDERAFGRFTPVDVAITGDVAAVADQMTKDLREGGVDLSRRRLMPGRPVGDPATAADPRADESGSAALDVRHVLARIDQTVPEDRTLVCDSGRHVAQALKLLGSRGIGSYVHTMSFGSIGLGMGYAVGAAFGRPDRTVLLTVGDGGFMLGGLTEFNTAVRYGLNIIVVVLNDASYGAEYEQFHQRSLDPGLSLFEWPDLAAVATALGGRGMTVRDYADLEVALSALPQDPGPTLIDVKLDPATMPLLDRV